MRRKSTVGKNRSLTIGIIVIGTLFLVSGTLLLKMYLSNADGDVNAQQIENHLNRSTAVNGKEFEAKMTLAAIGDILIHDRVYEDAEIADGYDFKPMLKAVKPELLQPEILLANQETILAGTEIGLSSYPSFNSPQEVGDAIIDAGVDIVSTANNHTLDRGERGALASIDYWNKVGLPYVGSFKDTADQQRLRILNQDGIKLAFLSYTYGTNGIPVPAGKDYLVNLIDKEKIKEEVHRARQVADVVVMSIHWGNEYQRFPDNQQQDLAAFMAEEGVDVIFGHHPHVLQPMDWITNSDGRKTFIIYSLGNFLSGQMWDYKDIGGMASIDITKHSANGETTIQLDNPQFYPTFVASKGQRNYRVVPLLEAGKHGLENAEAKYTETVSHVFQFIK